MNRGLAVALALAIGLAACGSDSSGGSLIGATCKVSSDCDVAGLCLTDGKDGLCSMACNVPGGAGECMLGGYCDRGSFTSDTHPTSEMTVCLPACKKDSDCRDGYRCKGVSGGPGSVCAPK
jgi:hypothetical protein